MEDIQNIESQDTPLLPGQHGKSRKIVNLSLDVANRLFKLRTVNSSYNDVVTMLLDHYDKTKIIQQP